MEHDMLFYTNHYHRKTFCICKKFNPKHALNMKSTFPDLIHHTVFTHCNPCLFLDYRASLFVISYILHPYIKTSNIARINCNNEMVNFTYNDLDSYFYELLRYVVEKWMFELTITN